MEIYPWLSRGQLLVAILKLERQCASILVWDCFSFVFDVKLVPRMFVFRLEMRNAKRWNKQKLMVWYAIFVSTLMQMKRQIVNSVINIFSVEQCSCSRLSAAEFAEAATCLCQLNLCSKVTRKRLNDSLFYGHCYSYGMIALELFNRLWA